MAEEVVTGQPAPAPAPVEAPVAQPAPAEPTPSPAPVQAGKSVETLVAEMEEMRRQTQQALEKAARAEHEASYMRTLIEQQNRETKPTAEAVPEVPPVSDDEFLTNPAKATAKIVSYFREQDKKEQEKKAREQYVERAKSLYETGRKQATTQLGKLLGGIENEVSLAVQQGVISGAITPEQAQDPDVWSMTAIAYRFKERGERNFDKYFSTAPTPPPPSYTEVPSPGAPPRDVVMLSEEERLTARQWGISDEQYLAQKKRSIEEQTRLAR